MSLKATSSGKDFEPAPEGVHIGRCFGLVDLGTQKTTFKGQTKFQKKVLIQWELPLVKRVFDEGKGDEPVIVSNRYTNSIGPKSTLSKHLTAWSGKALSGQEEFDLTKIVGKPCQLQIIHREVDGQVFANIAAIMPLPNGMTCPAAINKPVVYDLDMGKNDVFKSLSERLQERISECAEWTGQKQGEEVQHHPTDDSDPGW